MRWRMWVILGALAALILGGVSLSAGMAQSDCDETTGTIERVELASAALNRRVTTSVYLPPCYEQAAPLPYVILLHGSNRDDRHWLQLGLAELLDAGIAAGDLPAMAVVMPYGGQIANSNTFGADSWGAALIQDVIPQAEARWPLDSHRRAIGGISRGGFWAYQVGLLNPAMFTSIGGHSAFFDADHAPDDANPLDLARTVRVPVPRLWIDRGADDYAAPGLELMADSLMFLGAPYTYQVYDSGAHNDAYWGAHIADYLRWYGEPWRSQPVMFATATPDSDLLTTPPATAESPGLRLFVPVAAFPSMRFNLERAALDALLRGELDPKLTLTDDARDALEQFGVSLHPDTQVVLDNAALDAALFRDRTRWAIIGWGEMTLRLRILWVDETPVIHQLETYPLLLSAEGQPSDFDPARLSTVLASGVTALTRQTRVALDENGVAWAAEGISDITRRADIFHVSNEVSFTRDCPLGNEVRLNGGASFCSRPEHFDLLALLGVDVVELTGNHNNDFGYDAYRETFEFYQTAGYQTVGGGLTPDEARQPLILDLPGGRVAWVACNAVGPYFALASDNPNALGGARPGAAECNRSWLRSTLPELRAQADVVILSVQYLEADRYDPTPSQRQDFIAWAQMGADIVLGTQAHFPQTMQIVRGLERPAYVHFGLGNFLFDQNWWAGARFNMDEMVLYDGALHSVGLVPGIIEGRGRPRLMTAEERENFLYVLFNQYGTW